MTHGIKTRASVPKGLLYAVGLAVLWGVLAAFSPETTYHLAPFLVAGAPPILDAADEAGGHPSRAAALAATGTLIALVGTGILAAAGLLQGPSLLPTGGAVLESVAFSITGGVVGLVGGVVLSKR